MPLKTTRLYFDVDYDDNLTDPEGLASAVDVLMETALSTPGILEDYGDPRIGPCFVLTQHPETD
jgi:hypothetical protein